MTRITSIQLQLNTADVDGAGTNGDVYLGVCGREFFVDSEDNDFEAGSSRGYVFGEGSNVNNAASNDPRLQVLNVEDVDRFPVYIRLEQPGGTSRWKLQRAQVSFNGDFFPLWDTASLVPQDEGIWLGHRDGRCVHIPRHRD